MALALLVLLVGAVSPAISQFLAMTQCSYDPVKYSLYVSTSPTCCSSFVLTALLRQCCVQGSTCLCSPTLSYPCPGATTTVFNPFTTPTPTPTPAPTTATTTTTTTTTTAAPVVVITSVAPAPGGTLCTSPSPSARILNASPISSEVCTGSGTIGFTTASGQVCNGAYGKDPATGATVIYTLSSCWTQNPTEGIVGSETIPFDSCSVQSVSTSPLNPSLTTLTLSDMASFFFDKMFESCPTSDCVYNPFLMQNAIDWRKCYVASYGATSLGATGGQLNMTPVNLVDITQCLSSPSGVATGSQCFSSTSGTPCFTDNGAPVYCSLTTGEQVLYGVTTVSSCVSGVTSFNVMPVFNAIGQEVPLP